MSGWGEGSRGKLSALKIKIKDCEYDYPNIFNIPSPDNEDFFCAISRIGSGCHGDSGGPMICEENDKAVFYGVASAVTDKRCRENFVNIYANIYQHIELIESALVK